MAFPATSGVDDKLTPLTPDQAAKALSDGYLLVTGKRPSKEILSLLIAQTAEETGNWKSLHHYNFGNVRGVAEDGLWTSFRAGEIINGEETFLEKDLSPTSINRFRAYRDAAHGGAAYVKALKDRPNWWNGLQTGTVEGFIRGLTTAPYKYFTANPISYQNLMVNRVGNYQALAKQYAAPIGIAAVLVTAVAGVFGFMAIRKVRQRV
jgi:hypothetical protein